MNVSSYSIDVYSVGYGPVISTRICYSSTGDSLTDVHVCVAPHVVLQCRALKRQYINHDMIEMMEPSIMFAIPRLAIVWYVRHTYTLCLSMHLSSLAELPWWLSA